MFLSKEFYLIRLILIVLVYSILYHLVCIHILYFLFLQLVFALGVWIQGWNLQFGGNMYFISDDRNEVVKFGLDQPFFCSVFDLDRIRKIILEIFRK